MLIEIVIRITGKYREYQNQKVNAPTNNARSNDKHDSKQDKSNEHNNTHKKENTTAFMIPPVKVILVIKK